MCGAESSTVTVAIIVKSVKTIKQNLRNRSRSERLVYKFNAWDVSTLPPCLFSYATCDVCLHEYVCLYRCRAYFDYTLHALQTTGSCGCCLNCLISPNVRRMPSLLRFPSRAFRIDWGYVLKCEANKMLASIAYLKLADYDTIDTLFSRLSLYSITNFENRLEWYGIWAHCY